MEQIKVMEQPQTITITTKTKKETIRDSPAEISIKQFLNCVKTAYQVKEELEGVLLDGGMTAAVNWLKLKETNKTDDDDNDDKDSVKKKFDNTNDEIKKKISEVLSEGLLDSVLPHLLKEKNSQNQQNIRSKSQIKITQHSDKNSNNINKKRSSDHLNTSITNIKPIQKSPSEVEIHVCDEMKNTKRDFYCNQKLLTEKMGYFAQVTSGQKLEDMDISVHCDIGIFEWLMNWVKKDKLMKEDWPILDVQCVVPILVSAFFLQMEPLLNDCLLFCHEFMNDVLKTATNLNCINDSVLTRLAAMYTNMELEGIRDKKDKIQSRLYTKLILSLNEVEPESVRGHWMSLAGVYRCEKCQQLVNNQVGPRIPCIPPCMRFQWDGSLVAQHQLDATWNINEYILQLYKQLKTWRKVYWHLWGDAHYLYCLVCKKFFPVNQIGWCRHHPEAPQFFSVDNQKAPLPIGRFPCCGERAYRFELVENWNSGCNFREHQISLNDVKDSAIFNILQTYRNLIEEEPPQLLFPERLTRLVAKEPNNENKFLTNEKFWWDGIEIVPPRPKLGLLTNFINNKSQAIRNSEYIEELLIKKNYETSSDCTEDDDFDDDEGVSYTTTSSSDISSNESSSSTKESTESNPLSNTKKNQTKLPPKRMKPARVWQHNLSARSNQDNQRSNEETAMKYMTTIIKRKTQNSTESSNSRTIINNLTSNKSFNRNKIPLGGLWVRLETEWREQYGPSSAGLQQQSQTNGKNKLIYNHNHKVRQIYKK